MARSVNQAVINNFIGGLITDYHELNTPQNVSVDEDNCDIDRKGYRRRRKGIEFEDGYSLAPGPTPEAMPNYYIKCHEWTSVANDGSRIFLVVQVGATLYFYDKGTTAISAGKFGYTINLNNHLAPAHTDTSDTPVQVSSGKGTLFVVGKKIVPFFVQYDSSGGTFSTTAINIRIRDLENTEELYEPNPLPNDAIPTTLEKYRIYDLFNQGWFLDHSIIAKGGTPGNVIDHYHTQTGHYPPKTKPWFFGKTVDPKTGDTVFDGVNTYDQVAGGNTLAALGHYILDPFNKDRNTAADLENIPIIVENDRPNAVAFFAGRVFYGFKNKIFYSQIINTDFSVANKCYQDADPTAENISDLIDTDGGEIQISEAGAIEHLFPMLGSLIVFAANGIWSIQGGSQTEGFSATNYSITAVASINAVNFRTIINVEGSPVFWGDNGIYALQPRQNYAGFEVQNIIDKKIQSFYDSIPALSKAHATGIYDRVRKTIIWMYPSEVFNINPYACNKLLHLDTVLGAYYPYTIPSPDSGTPFICDVFIIRGLVTSRTEEDVVDNSNAVVTTIGGSTVFAYTYDQISPSLDTGGVKYLTFTPST